MPESSKKDSELTSSRKQYLKQLEKLLAKNPVSGILAPDGTGKTFLLRHLTSERYFYLDMKTIAMSPENFAVDFIGSICFFQFSKDRSELADYQTIDRLKELKLQKRCSDIITKIDNELQKKKPDHALITELAFSFPEAFAEEQKKEFFMLLNNFEELFSLNNFPQIEDVVELFIRNVSHNKAAKFIIASSSVQLMKSRMKGYLGADMLVLEPLKEPETKELFESIAGKTDARVIKEVQQMTGGVPVAVKAIAKRFSEEKKGDASKDVGIIRTILLTEICIRSSPLYIYCSRLFYDSLNRARGASLLKTIMKVMAQNRPLRLTEIANLIYRSGPVTKSLLERLIEVDLIIKSENTFMFANPVLKQWCTLMFKGIEFETMPDAKTLKNAGGTL